MTTFADEKPHAYYAAIGRFRKLIAAADARKDTMRAAQLRVSLMLYRMTANSTYGKGTPRDEHPRTKTVR